MKHHHNPEGMVALCLEHHAQADAGLYSRGELDNLKRSSVSTQEVRAQFPWAKRDFLVILGGNYWVGSRAALEMLGHPIVRFHRGAEGLLMLSLDLHGEDGQQIVAMENNAFRGEPTLIHDLQVNYGQSSLRVWHAERRIGLELRFRRVSMTQFDELLDANAERSRADAAKSMKESLARSTRAGYTPPPGWIEAQEAMDRAIAEAVGAPNPRVKSYALSRCLDDEQKVSLLDFDTLVTYSGGQRLQIQNGVHLGSISMSGVLFDAPRIRLDSHGIGVSV